MINGVLRFELRAFAHWMAGGALLEYVHPVKMDGIELLRRVRALGQARGGRLPAIALTAFARLEDRTRALRAGFLVHVSKPVEPSELVATVASVSGRSNAQTGCS